MKLNLAHDNLSLQLYSKKRAKINQVKIATFRCDKPINFSNVSEQAQSK